MKISIIAVGKIKEKYLASGIAEYQKRLMPYCKLNIVEVAEERLADDFSSAQKNKALAQEGTRILKKIDLENSYLIVLDGKGTMLSSEELSKEFDLLTLSGKSNLTFVIGGAFGLSETVLSAAEKNISFSKMTFTHQMIRLFLTEQIYRAFKISRGEKYHW